VSADTSEQWVRVTRHADLGRITLTRPAAINALSGAMIDAIDAALEQWAGDSSVALVVIDGEGERGLCAGGDIKAMYGSARGDGELARSLWRNEYRMNARIDGYPKPVLALMHGLVLGGGVGISAHASLRVVTANSRVGMPETGIGMVPDIGGTWLLGHAPAQLGTHLALTGQMLGPADALHCGLADVYVEDDQLTALRNAPDAASALALIEAARHQNDAGPVSDWSWVSACYAADTVTEILDGLNAHGSAQATAAAAVITGRCPTAQVVTLRALRSAAELPSLRHALDQEYRMVCQRLVDPDFVEGIRAQVIDKDRKPRWNPATLAEVDPAFVDRHFAMRANDELGLADTAPAEQGSAELPAALD
jgi:enoyl-CoA hydratase